MPTPTDPLTARAWPGLPPLAYLGAAGLILVAGPWAIFLLWKIRLVLFLAFFALLLASLMSLPIDWLSRKIPRSLATLAVLLVLVGVVGGLIALGLPRVGDEIGKVLQQIPAAADKLQEELTRRRSEAPPAGEKLASGVQNRIGEELAKLAGQLFPVAWGSLMVVTGILVILATAAFVSYSPDVYRRGILRLTPPRAEGSVAEFLTQAALTLRHWLTGTLIAMATMAVMVAVSLAILGVKAWPALALVMFFCEFVPFLGPVLGAIPAIAVGLTASTRLGVEVAALYFVLQHLEGYLVQPLVMRRAIHLKPAVLILWQVTMSVAFGVPGLMIATPLLACVQVGVEHFYVREALGRAPA